MVKSSIVDQYGRPIEKKVLGQEIATPELSGVRRTAHEAVASGLTPEGLAALLRDAANGHARRYLTLAEEMEERYLHYASQLQTRRLAIDGVAATVEVPDGVPTKIVDAVNELIEASGFEAAASDCGDGIGKGFSAIEMIWDYADRRLKPVEYKWRDPRFFQFDELSLTELRLAVDGSRNGEELPPAKFIRHFPKTKAGIPLRAGLARPAAWAFLIQSFGLKDWAAFAEVYGVPLRIGRYGPNASAADKKTLLRAVKMIASDAAAIVPDGMSIEFQKIEGQHGAAVFGELIDYVDRQISKLVVGQTMTADDGSSLAQAQIHNEVRLDILKADCKQLAQTLNRDLIAPFVAMNFGPQAAYPQVLFPVTEPEDVKALTESVARLVPLGFKVGQRELREKLGLSDPQADDELLTPPANAAAPEPDTGAPEPEKREPKKRGRKRTAMLAATPPATDGIDEVAALTEEILADWEDITDPLLDPIRDALAKATSFEEALALIEANGPDGSALAERLAKATAIARGIGDLED